MRSDMPRLLGSNRLRAACIGLLAAWLTTPLACSVSTEDIAFIPDDEFHGTYGGSGAQAGGPADSGTGTGAAGTTGADSCGSKAEGDARCSGEVLEVCKAGAYSTVQVCESTERCNMTRRTCLDCAPGTFRCTGDNLEQCNLEGSAFEVVQTCQKGACSAAEASGFCVVCEAGQTLCEPIEREFFSAGTIESDRSMRRESLRACNEEGSGTTLVERCGFRAPVCDLEEGRCLTCATDEVVCVGSQLLQCSRDRNGFELVGECGHPSLCDAVGQRCLPARCANAEGDASPADTVSCRGSNGTELALCQRSGQWEILDLCDTVDACNSGIVQRRCLDAEADCIPGASRCEDDTLVRCAPFSDSRSLDPTGGAWYSHASCSDGCVVNGSGLAGCSNADGPRPYTDSAVCAPGETDFLDCSGASCEDSVCEPGQLCAGSAWGCRACVPDNFRCDGNVLVRCNADGSGEAVQEDCKAGVCDRFRGKCLPTAPGERFCVEGELLRVAADGATQAVERCGAEALCSAESGCTAPACIIGSKACGGEEGRQVLSCPDGVALGPTPTRCASADRCEDGLGCVGVFRVAAGEAHTCALMVPENAELDAMGLLKCWGANESGQLGNGSSLLGDESEARPVVFLTSATNLLTAGARFLTSGLCAGKNFTCADARLAEGPTVVCWGSNTVGQLGLGESSTAAAFNAVTGPVTRGEDVSPRDGKPDAFLGLSAVTCGENFACALDAAGRPWCWGANDVGQLGTGKSSPSFMPTGQEVLLDVGRTFKHIVAGARHACALDDSDELWCWGGGAHGQLGQSTPEPSIQPLSLGSASAYALGRDFTLVRALLEGEVVSFGSNFFGQLATGTDNASNTGVVAAALSELDIESLLSGPLAAHGCARIGGSLSCWGANPLGQLGNGSTIDSPEPVVAMDGEVMDLFGGAGTVALGRSHTCAVDASGSLWCWGGNQRKQLGASVGEPWIATPTEVLVALWSSGPSY